MRGPVAHLEKHIERVIRHVLTLYVRVAAYIAVDLGEHGLLDGVHGHLVAEELARAYLHRRLALRPADVVDLGPRGKLTLIVEQTADPGHDM